MQVYVHLAGKNQGPYSIDQLRQYVQAGNFKDARLRGRDDRNIIIEYLENERENLIGDFQQPAVMDNPYILARLGGEIAAFDRIYQTLKDESAPGDKTVWVCNQVRNMI